jgi:hypothetical protein
MRTAAPLDAGRIGPRTTVVLVVAVVGETELVVY